ncbi:MAG: DUF479 domain-containing protein [Okeania sp. SIO2C9]|uniref:acyl carrier protein phosphodiesterase n=1 Tax=Okeania sp. SIO2C9 TaxID=2607791 RepID=UPI0013C171F9|nr:acyl carrier protein phosphodiesterase [Okeania sp. SIO2C9]NEQ75002.1 DUF479 domain-containing protein [Okeania sp. SIO2C9]
MHPIILQKNQEILPDKLQKILPKIISENRLSSYKNLSGINLSFVPLSKRLKRENNLATAGNELIKNYTEIESDFLTFFPEVINYVKNRNARNFTYIYFHVSIQLLAVSFQQ